VNDGAADDDAGIDSAGVGAEIGVLGVLLIVVTAFGWLGSLCCALAYVRFAGPEAIEGTGAFAAGIVGTLVLTVTLMLSSGTALYFGVRLRRRWPFVLAAVLAVAAVALYLDYRSYFP
jgi:hypothetical protein